MTILFDERIKLKKQKSGEDSVEIDEKIRTVEEKIAALCAESNRRKVIEKFSVLSGKDNAVNTNGMWALKKKVFPKNMKSLPSCKKDNKGNLITEPSELKSSYLQTYKHSLRHRPIKDSLVSLKMLNQL